MILECPAEALGRIGDRRGRGLRLRLGLGGIGEPTAESTEKKVERLFLLPGQPGPSLHGGSIPHEAQFKQIDRSQRRFGPSTPAERGRQALIRCWRSFAAFDRTVPGLFQRLQRARMVAMSSEAIGWMCSTRWRTM